MVYCLVRSNSLMLLGSIVKIKFYSISEKERQISGRVTSLWLCHIRTGESSWEKKHWSLGKCQEGRENGIQVVSGECGGVQGLMMLEENG